MDVRQIARGLAFGRIAIGSGLLLAPKRTGRVWLGPVADQPATATVVRSLGARDLGLGVGLAQALDTDNRPELWVLAAVAADASDVVGTILAWRDLPRMGRLLTATMAAAATVQGLTVARRLTA
jgi:hypothetical protein